MNSEKGFLTGATENWSQRYEYKNEKEMEEEKNLLEYNIKLDFSMFNQHRYDQGLDRYLPILQNL